MTNMAEQSSNVWGFRKAPKWQQVFIAFIFVTGGVTGGLFLIDTLRDTFFGSPKARAIKNQLSPLAAQLENAQRVGDRQTVIALYDPVTRIINDYNALDAAKRAEINNSPLRYCVLASVHLGSGISEVLESGHWLEKDRYQNAFDMCK